MTSKSTLPYYTQAKLHPNPVVKQLFNIAEAKRSNVIISADMRTTKELLELANSKCGNHISSSLSIETEANLK